jgi:hypothetical protein
MARGLRFRPAMGARTTVLVLALAASLTAVGVALAPELSLAPLMLLGLVGLAWGGGASRPAPPRAQLVIHLRVSEPR